MASNSLLWLFVARGVCGRARQLKKNPTIDEGNDMITITATNRYKNITSRQMISCFAVFGLCYLESGGQAGTEGWQGGTREYAAES